MRSSHRTHRSSSHNTKVALAGLGALAVVASLGGGASNAEAVDAAAARTIGPAARAVDADTIGEVDFGEVAQPGSACTDGLRFSLAGDIPVSDGRSQVLDLARLTQLVVDPDVAVGDVTGDGIDDAVVHVQCAFGANGVEDSIHLWTLDGGRLTHVAGLEGGAGEAGDAGLESTVQGVAASDGRLTVTWSSYADDDPHCCPTQQTRVAYELDGDELAPVGEPVTSAARP